jgi:hypothetical protein
LVSKAKRQGSVLKERRMWHIEMPMVFAFDVNVNAVACIIQTGAWCLVPRGTAGSYTMMHDARYKPAWVKPILLSIG